MSLYFRQLLAGRDFAVTNPVAAQMENFVYLIGDTDTRECVVVDPAWGVDDLLDLAEADGMKVVAGLATHYHPDHVGGTMYGFTVEGAARFVARAGVKLHCHRAEDEGVRQVTGLSSNDLVLHDSGDKVLAGKVEIEWLHTPGHTPGSSCFRLKDGLVAGDTVFLHGCGRVDLPGGDSETMYYTITQRLASLPGSLELWPGHRYGGAHAPLETVRRTNPYLQVKDLLTWKRAMGG